MATFRKYRRPSRSYNKKTVFKVLSKDQIEYMLNLLKMEGPIYLKTIEELKDIAKKHNLTILAGMGVRKKFKNDYEVLDFLEELVKIFIKYSDDIKSKIDEELPETINLYSDNLNISTAVYLLTIISDILYMPRLLDTIISMYDNALNKKVTLFKVRDKVFLNKILFNLEELYINDMLNSKNISAIIDSIGNYPSTNVLSNSVPLKIRNEIISGILGSNKLGKILSTILSSFKVASSDKYTLHYDSLTRNKNLKAGFAGNPIYYIRKIIADLEINRYEKRKLEKKKLELQLQYIKEKASKEMDPKKAEIYKKQIEILEDKIEKLEAKQRMFEDKLSRK